ncbi:maleylpyruvate isomerase family mycothiol-dependent enzyme [Streptomyces sp. NPDC048483]|uniref:maleylpyruvate isomerase family mycothiol-dependent enzyme n=1 Tax=Streptomyces sp. NPDC048483 TaxID=3154927 RepID=UPI0034450D1C
MDASQNGLPGIGVPGIGVPENGRPASADDGLLVAEDASMKRFVETVGGLTQQQAGGATLIPPWTRGHVITHVARASDSLCRLLEGARTGVEIPQYASMAAREEEIEAGAGRPVAALLEDVLAGAVRFDEAVRTLPEEAWRRRVRLRTGELRTPASLVATRLRELEVHHADLAAGYAFGDVPKSAARYVIDDVIGALAGRDGVPGMRIEATDGNLVRDIGGGGGPVIKGSTGDLLAWITGRGEAVVQLSVSGATDVPEAPYWI